MIKCAMFMTGLWSKAHFFCHLTAALHGFCFRIGTMQGIGENWKAPTASEEEFFL